MPEISLPKNTKPWTPLQEGAEAALSVQRGNTEEVGQHGGASASVPRKAISLGDFTNIKREVDEAKDFLFVPKELIPDGIAVEWKRSTVLNKPDKKHSAEVWRAGWRFIPSNSEGFAEHFASFISGDIFEYEGLVLMYRPETMSDASKKEEARKAGSLVQDKMEEIGLSSEHADMPGKRFQFNRGFEEKLPGGNPAAVTVPD